MNLNYNNKQSSLIVLIHFLLYLSHLRLLRGLVSALRVLLDSKLVQFKGLHVLRPDIVHLGEARQVVDEVKHFLVLGWLPVEGHDGDTIGKLVGEGIH